MGFSSSSVPGRPTARETRCWTGENLALPTTLARMAWCGQQQQQSSMGTCPCGNLPTCQIAKLPKCLSAHQLGPPMGHAHGVLHPYIDSQGQRQPVPTALDCRSNDHCTVKDRRVTASLLSGQMVRNSPGLAEITDFRGLGTHSPHMYRKFCKSLYS